MVLLDFIALHNEAMPRDRGRTRSVGPAGGRRDTGRQAVLFPARQTSRSSTTTRRSPRPASRPSTSSISINRAGRDCDNLSQVSPTSLAAVGATVLQLMRNERRRSSRTGTSAASALRACRRSRRRRGLTGNAVAPKVSPRPGNTVVPELETWVPRWAGSPCARRSEGPACAAPEGRKSEESSHEALPLARGSRVAGRARLVIRPPRVRRLGARGAHARSVGIGLLHPAVATAPGGPRSSDRLPVDHGQPRLGCARCAGVERPLRHRGCARHQGRRHRDGSRPHGAVDGLRLASGRGLRAGHPGAGTVVRPLGATHRRDGVRGAQPGRPARQGLGGDPHRLPGLHDRLVVALHRRCRRGTRRPRRGHGGRPGPRGRPGPLGAHRHLGVLPGRPGGRLGRPTPAVLRPRPQPRRRGRRGYPGRPESDRRLSERRPDGGLRRHVDHRAARPVPVGAQPVGDGECRRRGRHRQHQEPVRLRCRCCSTSTPTWVPIRRTARRSASSKRCRRWRPSSPPRSSAPPRSPCPCTSTTGRPTRPSPSHRTSRSSSSTAPRG